MKWRNLAVLESNFEESAPTTGEAPNPPRGDCLLEVCREILADERGAGVLQGNEIKKSAYLIDLNRPDSTT